MKLFAGSTNEPLARDIAKIGKIVLGRLEIHKFPDGETRIRILDDVMDEKVWVLQSRGDNPDSAYMELFFIVDGLRRSGAKSVGCIIPYLPYQRQDHMFRSGEAVSMGVIVKTLESTGAEKIITFDLHTIKIPELFGISVIHLSALSLFAKTIKDKFKDSKDLVLVSPDMGGVRRIKILSDELSTPYAVIEKDRDLATGEIKSLDFKGEIKKNAIIVDDMISTGRTIVAASDLLFKKGADKVYVFATHPIFSDDTASNFRGSRISEIYVTDSIYCSEGKRFEKLKILSLAEMISKEILKNDTSTSSVS